jgi:8-oxo-dGTP pyrophosphatase MutT (NUDIX family)
MPIPRSYKTFFREEDEVPNVFWGNEGAGALFISKDTGRLLLFLRSSNVNEPGTWNLTGGRIDYGESPKDAVTREVEEETGYDGNYKMSFLYIFRHRNFKYHNYLVLVPFEFTPQLNWEHDDSKWVEYGDWPSPLHFGLNNLINQAGPKIKRVVDLIKRKKEKKPIPETIDLPPPAIIRSIDHPSIANVADIKTFENAYVIAATLWGEARGEGEVGMHAVMNVIMNRAHGNFKKAKDVVLKPYQFSIWNNVKDPKAAAINLADIQRTGTAKEHPAYIKALELVDLAMRDQLPDITNGAIAYFNPKKANPKWAKVLVKTKSIGNHDFYRSPKKYDEGKKILKEDIEFSRQGLVDDGLFGYEIKSPFSRLVYSYEPGTGIFYLDNVDTPHKEDQDKGHATELLNIFFHLIKLRKGALDPGPYTEAGMLYVKPVVERLAKKYGIRLVRGRRDKYGYD